MFKNWMLISLVLLSGQVVTAESKCSPENTEKMLVLVQDMLESAIKHDGFLFKSIVKGIKSNKVSSLKKQMASAEFQAIKDSDAKVSAKLMEFASSHPECDSRNYRQSAHLEGK